MFFPALCYYPSVSFKDTLSVLEFLNQNCGKLENCISRRAQLSMQMIILEASKNLKPRTLVLCRVFLFYYVFLVCSFFFFQQEQEREIILHVHICVCKDHIGSDQIKMKNREGYRMTNLWFLAWQVKLQTPR